MPTIFDYIATTTDHKKAALSGGRGANIEALLKEILEELKALRALMEKQLAKENYNYNPNISS